MTDPTPAAVPAPAPASGAGPAGAVAGRRAELIAAVARLPALPRHDGDRYHPRNLTVLWLENLGSDHTRRAYHRALHGWLDWCARTALDPLAARRADVDAWMAVQTAAGSGGQDRPASANTVAQRRAAVSSWYGYLATNDACDRNPAAMTKTPKTAGTAKKAPVLSPAESAALLDHAERRAHRLGTEPAWRDAAVVALLFYTGVRVSAVTGADVTDLDRLAGYPILRYDKKGGGRDYVRLDGEVVRPLTAYLRLRAAREDRPTDRLGGPLLATTPHPHRPELAGGKRLVQRDVSTTLRTLARQAGLPAADRLSPHSGRGTAITLLLAHDVPLHKVQDLAGHADPRTTRGYDQTNHRLAGSPVTTLTALLAAHRSPTPEPDDPNTGTDDAAGTGPDRSSSR